MPNAEEQLLQLQSQIIQCTRCPRLVAWRQEVAEEKVRRFAHETYWGKPLPSFGNPEAKILIVGLAPAAHGGNRTGRMFTGDRSGDWLYGTLFQSGFANQPNSANRDDGLKLKDCYITAILRCAPPQNKPTAEEKINCFAYLLQEINLLENIQVIVALGKIAFDTVLNAFKEIERTNFSKRPQFGHGIELKINEKITLIASYHPSQQNTFTGKLTESMFSAIFKRARELIYEDI